MLWDGGQAIAPQPLALNYLELRMTVEGRAVVPFAPDGSGIASPASAAYLFPEG